VRFEFSIGKQIVHSTFGVNRTADWRAASLTFSPVPPRRLERENGFSHVFNRIGKYTFLFMSAWIEKLITSVH